jgi:hypothetical protein
VSVFRPRGLRRAPILVIAALLVASLPVGAGAAEPQNGFKTKHAPMLMPGPDAPAGTEIKALITVGDVIGGYRFEAIPDGISFMAEGKNAARVFVNHETSTVPFPYNGAAPTSANSFNDFDNAQVSELVIRKGGQILSSRYVIPSSANFHRFCVNSLATSDGFEGRPMLFTNEEGIDWVNRSGVQWPATEADPAARQIGTVVAYDVNADQYRPIWGLGRLNHENTLPVPGFGYPVLLTGDDAFNQVAAQSQVYAYIAANADAVWNDAGDLYAFAPDEANAAINDYFDFAVGSTASISGRFIPVPKLIATGRLPNGDDITSATVPAELGGPYPPPPADGTWQRPPGMTSGPGVDGPQWVLEHWSDLNNAFQFLRIEDMAYDKRPEMSNVIYMADSGRGLVTGASYPGPAFPSPTGRIWKMVLNPANPTIVDSLSVFIEGDDNPVKTVGEIHQPDNLETTVNGLYIQEDPGSSQSFTPQQQIDDAARATTARVWQYRFADASLNVVLKVDQSADEGPTDVDPAGLSRWGDWESSGIIDVSSVFGPGKFLLTVQAHTLWVEIGDGPDLRAPDGPDWLNKREGGQLLLVTIPGG